jgi:hypothetical protein
VIDGGGGNDRICSGSGEDLVSGEDGNDKIDAGSDDDVVSGGDGDDKLIGGDGIYDWCRQGSGTGTETGCEPALTGVTVDPSEIEVGDSATGTIHLDRPATSGGITVPVNDGGEVRATVPANVTVPEGQEEGDFSITTTADTEGYTLAVNATRGPHQVESAELFVVNTPPELSDLSLSTNSVTSGTEVTGTVTLTKPAPLGGFEVGIGVSNQTGTAGAIPPDFVTVLQGETQVQFQIQTMGSGTLTISALTNNIQSHENLTIN